MRIERIHGRYLLCGGLVREDFILPGQIWASADGSDREVRVHEVGGGIVSYTWVESDGKVMEHRKLAFNFQTRYCLVVDKD